MRASYLYPELPIPKNMSPSDGITDMIPYEILAAVTGTEPAGDRLSVAFEKVTELVSIKDIL